MQGHDGITVSSGGTVFHGTDAVNLFRAAVLSSALGLLKVGISPRRGLTITKALAMCHEYTGQKYKRTEIDRAREDLRTWIEAMKSALPVEVRS
jgi:type II secretory pathway component PulF